jgi:hypothetical protein
MTWIQIYFPKIIYYVQNWIFSVIQQILFVTKKEMGITWAVTVNASGKYQLFVIYEGSSTSSCFISQTFSCWSLRPNGLRKQKYFQVSLVGNIPDALNHWYVISLHHNDKESQYLKHKNSLTWIQAGKTSAGPLDLQRYGKILRRIRVLAGERWCSGLIVFRRDFVVNSCVPKNNEYRGAVKFMLPQSSTLKQNVSHFTNRKN